MRRYIMAVSPAASHSGAAASSRVESSIVTVVHVSAVPEAFPVLAATAVVESLSK